MLGGFFNRMYNGKGNRPDFTPENLPENRRELFFEMLKVRWSSLASLNLVYLLFLIPAVFWAWWNLELLMTAATELQEVGTTSINIWDIVLTYLLGNFVAMLPAGPAAAGVARVCRSWARDENAWVWGDFWQGFKENWKQGIAASFLTSLALYILIVTARYYFMMANTQTFMMIPATLVCVMLAVLGLAQMLLYPLMISYEMKFVDIIKNAVMLTLARLPWALLFGVIPLIPVLLSLFIPNVFVSLGAILFYAFFGLSFMWFIYASYANWVFDQYINPRIEGAPVNMGLRDDDDDDWGDPEPADDDEPEETDDEAEEASPEPAPRRPSISPEPQTE